MIHLKKSLLTLVALFAISTGAWADYTVTWEGTTLQGIAVRNNTATTSQTVEGITVTASNGDFFYNTTHPEGPVVIASSYADNGLVFSAENNIKSIAITFTEAAYYGGSPTFEAGAHTYQVSPAAKSFALPKNDSFVGITKVVFTLEGDAPIELTPDADKKVWTLAEMPASNIELQVEYEPTKVTMAANDKTMGTVEVSGENKVEWTADTWKGWTSSTKEHTVDDITMTSSESASIYEYDQDGDYLHSLFFYVSREDNNSTVTISTTGDPFSRIEFTMIDDYAEDKYIENKGWLGNPVITPKENWTFSGKSAVWEGEATKSLKLQSCTTWVSKITFFKAGVPDGVTINTDGTFTVAKTATVTLKATPAEGYKFLYWEDDQTNTNPVREVTIESGMADKTYKAVFAEPTFNVTFNAANANTIEAGKATVTVGGTAATVTEGKLEGVKMGSEVKVTAKEGYKFRKAEAKKKAEALIINPVVGQIIGSDGKNYDANATLPDGVKAVAVIAYVDETNKNGLAIALADESGKMNWSTAKSTCEGKTPTVTGAKWCLPSQDQWKQMFKANGGNDKKYSGLNTTITTAGGTTLKEVEFYWSSSEAESGVLAYRVILSEGDVILGNAGEDNDHYVRACLAF